MWEGLIIYIFYFHFSTVVLQIQDVNYFPKNYVQGLKPVWRVLPALQAGSVARKK